MIKEAVILAGGFGTRLKSVIADVPKPMAPVAGKPFLAYLLNYLSVYGITRCVLSVGYKSEAIIDYFGNEYKGIQLAYAVENEPLGTGGGLFNALKDCLETEVLVLNGDTRFDVDLADLAEFHAKKNADVTLALKPLNDTSRYGTVKLNEEGRIIKFCEKRENTTGEGLINAGCYIFNQRLAAKKSGAFSLEKDFFEKELNQLHIFGFVEDAYFIDIGIPEDYLKAQHEFSL